MHRLQSVSQDDETHVKFKTKIWGKSKEFTAEIEEQVPDERIKWKVSEGVTHTGVVTFHELAPRLTRVEVNIDVEPGSLIEKAARGMRHVKRAVRADMHRFKAHVMMANEESGAWRGTIDDGEVKPRTPARSRSRSRASSASSGSSRSRGSSRRSGSSSRSKSGSSNGSMKASSSKSGSSNARTKASSSKSGSSSARTKASSSKSGSSNGRTKASSSKSGASNGRKRSTSRS